MFYATRSSYTSTATRPGSYGSLLRGNTQNCSTNATIMELNIFRYTWLTYLKIILHAVGIRIGVQGLVGVTLP